MALIWYLFRLSPSYRRATQLNSLVTKEPVTVGFQIELEFGILRSKDESPCFGGELNPTNVHMMLSPDLFSARRALLPLHILTL